eukprot:UN04976
MGFRPDCRRRPGVAIQSKVFAKKCLNHLDLSLAKVAKRCNHLDLSLVKVAKKMQSSRFIASKSRKKGANSSRFIASKSHKKLQLSRFIAGKSTQNNIFFS